MTGYPSDEELVGESIEDLYEHAPCGYLSTLPDGTIIKVNQTFLSWTGHQRSALLDRVRFVDLLTLPGKVFHETHYAPLLHMQGSLSEIALDVVCADGRRLPTVVNSTVKHDGSGRPRYVRTTLFDASDRRKYEREFLLERRRAEQAARAKADFLAIVSHEIRNPLHAIIAVADLLSHSVLSENQGKYIQILQAASSNLLNLVNDVLDYSKLEAGKQTLEEKRFELRELVHGAARSLQAVADQKRIRLDVLVDAAAPPSLIGDPLKIGQVLINLMSNALKFTPLGKVTLRVQLRERGPDRAVLYFSVTDTGIGIPADRLKAIFEDYTQAGSDVLREFGGTGLGLSISRRLLQLYGSTLEVQSAMGTGSTFAFELTLPIARPAQTGPDVPLVASARTLQGLSVLVAQRRSADEYMLAAMLHSLGLNVESVHTARQAVRRAELSSYDFVLLDLRLPESSAYAAAKGIRQLVGSKSQVPLIALSDTVAVGQRELVMQSGFSELVALPCDAQSLAKTLGLQVAVQRTVRAIDAGQTESGRSLQE